MKLAVGLVVKDGKEFIKKWIKSVEEFADVIYVVDNGADKEVWATLAFHPLVRQYHRQMDMGRNQSRDYQKILEMAREDDCTWIWNIDIDEIVHPFDINSLLNRLLNTIDDSVGFPLFEMRNDDKHYVMIRDQDDSLKHCRLCHKCYKVQSHFKFNEKDIHGSSIPHNSKPGEFIPIPIQHFGHYSKELREKKRKQYSQDTFKDFSEHTNTWLEEDESKITISKWRDNPIFKK